nr:amino acid permease [Paludibacterium sp. B53371]
MKSEYKIGVGLATFLVMANMLGSGISMVPAYMASIGTIGMVSWLIAIVGAVSLALVFSRLAIVDPAEGGVVAYASKVSPVLGRQTQIFYVLANLTGNLAVAATSIAYFSMLFPVLQDPLVSSIAIIVETWILAFIAMMGIGWVARLATLGVVMIALQIVSVGSYGWVDFSPTLFSQNWNVSGTSSMSAIFSGILVCLWSFLGVETASVNSGLVKNPTRTVPLATMLGVGLVCLAYFLSCTVVGGLFTMKELANTPAPWVLAVSTLFSPKLGPLVAAAESVLCFASLCSWIFIVAEAAARAGKDGTLPKIFAETNARGVPAKGIIIEAAIMTAAMIVAIIMKQNLVSIFGTTAVLASLFVLFPYFYSILYLLKRQEKKGALLTAAAILGMLFCFVAIAGGTQGQLALTLIVALALFLLSVRSDKAESAEEDVAKVIPQPQAD